MFFLVIAGVFGSCINSISNSPTDKKLQAWNCATDVVENELYNFSNAKVSSYGNSTVTYTESTEIYTIKGTVSYKNQFNSTANNKFTVQLKLTENGYSDPSILIYYPPLRGITALEDFFQGFLPMISA